MLSHGFAGKQWVEQFGRGRAGEAFLFEFAREFFLWKHTKLTSGPAEAFLAGRRDAAEEDAAVMDDDAKRRAFFGLKAAQVTQRLSDVLEGVG